MKSLTEDKVIIRHTRQWLETSQWSIETFATTLLIPALEDAGMAKVDRDSVESSAAAYTRWRRAESMKVGRIIRGSQPFPLAWKWVWVSCLPADVQREATRELVAMAGSLYVPIPKFCAMNPHSTRSRLDRMSQEFGELLQYAAPAHNGRYDANDCPVSIDRMMKEGVDLIEAVTAELVAICKGTGRQLPRIRMIAIETGE